MATVVFSRGPQQPFDYRVPDRLRGQIAAGQRVRAPFGQAGSAGDRLLRAAGQLDVRRRRLKEVDSIVDEQRCSARPCCG